MNRNRIVAFSICPALICSFSSVPVYAETTGTITVSASVKTQGFNGEIYVILADSTGNQKLALLTQNNKYNYKLDNLQYNDYKIKEVRVFSIGNQIDKDKNRQSMLPEYTVDYNSLNLNDNNKNPSVNINILSLQTQDTKGNDNNETDTNVENKTNTSENTVDMNNTNSQVSMEAKKSQSRKQNFIFWNFIIDVILIGSLGAVWFFKIRKKKEDE